MTLKEKTDKLINLTKKVTNPELLRVGLSVIKAAREIANGEEAEQLDRLIEAHEHCLKELDLTPESTTTEELQ